MREVLSLITRKTWDYLRTNFKIIPKLPTIMQNVETHIYLHINIEPLNLQQMLTPTVSTNKHYN